MTVLLLLLGFVHVLLAQEPFQGLENTVGYIVIERGSKMENYVVTEEKDGSVKLIRTPKNPKDFLNKVDEGTKK